MAGIEVGRLRLLFRVGAIAGASTVDLIGAEHDALNPCAGKPERNFHVGVIGSFRVVLTSGNIRHGRRVDDQLRLRFIHHALNAFLIS